MVAIMVEGVVAEDKFYMKSKENIFFLCVHHVLFKHYIMLMLIFFKIRTTLSLFIYFFINV